MRKFRLLGPLALIALAVVITVVPRAGARSHNDPADASGPLDLSKVGLRQVRRDVELSVQTRGMFSLADLDRRPDPSNPDDRFICLHIHRTGSSGVHQLCFGQRPSGDQDTLGYARLRSDGSVRSWKPIGARVSRPDRRSAVARFRPGDADLRPHHYRWQVLSQWSGSECPLPLPKSKRRSSAPANGGTAPANAATATAPAKREARAAGVLDRDPCLDKAPSHREAKFHLRPVQPVGCTHGGPSLRFHGSRHHKRVALSFDDGPSAYTPRILSVLEDKHAKGTFFEIGDEIPGRTSISRAVLKSGNELGNHSLHHESKPSRASMAATNDRIESATGFEPCLFRPPYGAYDSRVVSDARSLGMTTIIWDVDPTDWAEPGSDVIYNRVVSNTRPGSIVLMHDGGGNRSQTVAALPRIIHTLRKRGYRFLTVTKLLGEHLIWRPVG